MPRLAPTVRRATLALAAAAGLLASTAAGQGCPCGTLADEFRAADAGLVREWIVQVPFDSAGHRLERVTVGDGLVVAESGDGGIHAIRSSWSRPRLAFPGVENHPDLQFFLHLVERLPQAGGRRDPAPAKARRIPIEGPDPFALPAPDDAAPGRERPYVTAATLLVVPKAALEAMPPNQRRSLNPETPGVTALPIAVDELNACRHHVLRYAVSTDARDAFILAPQFERAGTVGWSRFIAAAAGHSWPATIGTEQVVVASELAVHALDRDTGSVDWDRPTDELTAASAVQSGPWVYAPLSTKRLLRLAGNPLGVDVVTEPPPGQAADQRAAPESPDPMAVDAGGACQSAPLLFAAGILWATDNGLATLQWSPLGWIRHDLPDAPPPTWERRNPVALAGPPAVRGREIYLATSAGALARVDLDAKDLPGLRTRWTTLLAGGAAAGPLVSGDVVIVSLGPAGLAAFSAADGLELWRSDVVGTLLATAGGRAWILDVTGRLSAVDLATGTRRQTLCLGCLTVPVVNPTSERLVLASPSGLVVSLAAPGPSRPALTAGARPPRAPAPEDPAATPR